MAFANREPAVLPEFPHPQTVDLSDLARGILGYGALSKAKGMPVLPSDGNTNEATTVSAATYPSGPSIANEITHVKDDLEGMSFRQKQLFNELTTKQVDADLAQHGLTGRNYQVDWVNWLVQDASRHEVLGFCAWGAARLLAAQTAPTFLEQVAAEKRSYKRGMDVGLRAGALHEEAESARDKVPHIVVRLGDFADMQAQSRRGYAQQGGGVIVVREPASSFLLATERKTIRHEITHAAMLGLQDILHNEVGTEQIAHAVDDARWQSLNPLSHLLTGAYRGCRHVVDAVRPNGAMFVTRAYSARTPDARSDMKLQLDKNLRGRKRQVLSEVMVTLHKLEVEAKNQGLPASSVIEEFCMALVANKMPSSLDRALMHRNRNSRRAFLRKAKLDTLKSWT